MRSRDELMNILDQEFPKMYTKYSENFNGNEGAIWTGEGSSHDHYSLFNMYVEDYLETTYIMGVYKPLYNLLEESGWHAEFYDAGTVFLYPNSLN